MSHGIGFFGCGFSHTRRVPDYTGTRLAFHHIYVVVATRCFLGTDYAAAPGLVVGVAGAGVLPLDATPETAV